MESSKWLGQCPGCGAWGSFVEEPVVRTSTGKAVAHKESRQPSKLSEVEFSEDTRIASGIEELDRVLGGGIVVGSLVLVGGDPGIGKSTLLLQMCQKLVQQGKKVLYVSGEESEKQIKMRADRLGVFQSDLLVMSETDLDIVAETITRSTRRMLSLLIRYRPCTAKRSVRHREAWDRSERRQVLFCVLPRACRSPFSLWVM